MREAVIREAIRTPIGCRGGMFRALTAVDLGVAALRGMIERNGISPSVVEDVILGHCNGKSEAPAIGRVVLPVTVAGHHLDRHFGSGLRSVIKVVLAVQSGVNDEWWQSIHGRTRPWSPWRSCARSWAGPTRTPRWPPEQPAARTMPRPCALCQRPDGPRSSAREGVDDSFRVNGGQGFSKEYEIERLYRGGAPMLLIGEGITDIQRMIIGRDSSRTICSPGCRSWIERNDRD